MGTASGNGDAPVALAGFPLLRGIPPAEIGRLEHFMSRFELEPGEHLFRQGDESSSMYLIESGHIDVELELADATSRLVARLGPGENLGENSLLAGTRRSASAVAHEPVSGWMLYREGFEMLRLSAAAGAVELMARLTEASVERLGTRYGEIALELGQAAGMPAQAGALAGAAPASPELANAGYLRGLLCFHEFFEDSQITEVIGGAVAVELPRGALLIAPGATSSDLLLVVRGAVDVSVRGAGGAQRVRLAGPGRFVGHIGALQGRASPVAAHTRERLVLLAIPGERVRAMLRDHAPWARRFSAALAQDLARAMRQADRPIARTSAAGAAFTPGV